MKRSYSGMGISWLFGHRTISAYFVTLQHGSLLCPFFIPSSASGLIKVTKSPTSFGLIENKGPEKVFFSSEITLLLYMATEV